MFNTILFGKYLSDLRKKNNLTQSEVADKLNLTRQAVSRYETGDSFPDVSILLEISKVYNVSLSDLINSGNPTLGESFILNNIANKNEDIVIKDLKDLENIAPLIKPNTLDKLAKNLASEGIDISNIINCASYFSDDALIDMLCNKKLKNMDSMFFEKLLPVFDSESRYKIFDKVLDGELDWRLVRQLVCIDNYMYELVEACVIEGGLPYEALDYANLGKIDNRSKRVL